MKIINFIVEGGISEKLTQNNFVFSRLKLLCRRVIYQDVLLGCTKNIIWNPLIPEESLLY